MALQLDGYFDESERPKQGKEPISLAGYVFKPTAYKGFCREWKALLKSGPAPTTHFHMTHLYARSYEYEGWTVDERAAHLASAIVIVIVRKYMHFGVSVLISQADFERLAPPLYRFQYGSIYATACQMVLAAASFWMKEHNSRLPTAYAFESGHRFWDEADGIMKGIAKVPALKQKYCYRTHFAMDKTESYGLQAADMFAWIMTRLNVGLPDTHSMRAFIPIIPSLVEGLSHRYQLFHPAEEGLLKYFDDQITNPNVMLVQMEKARKLRLR
jgi:hypothetical protein